MQDFFATCPKGIEQLLAQELAGLGCADIRETVAGVSFRADMPTACRVCLWSRLANLVLVPVHRFAAENADELYQGVKAVNWLDHIRPAGRLWIDFSGTSRELRNTQFAAQKVKDAIVDRVRDARGTRPSIDRERPDLVVNARLSNGQVVINLDMCGESLHRRGYRSDTVKASMKENLAAALLQRAGWPVIAAQGGALIDPMCGSGTFLIEGAMIAADIAPGLMRAQMIGRRFAFEAWPAFQGEQWKILLDEAVARRSFGLKKHLPDIFGYDENLMAVRATERNLLTAGLSERVVVRKKPLSEFARPTHKTLKPGLVISNPPYGERLSDEEALKPVYRRLGEALKSDFSGWQAAVFTANPLLGKQMGLRARKKYKFFNGALPAELLLFDVSEEHVVRAGPSKSVWPEKPTQEQVVPPVADAGKPLSEGGQMVANRLRKNHKVMKSWRNKQQVDCYRLYDADLPEYAAAVDVYHDVGSDRDYYHVQEYAAPKSVDESKAQQRFSDFLQALAETFALAPDRVSVKQRRRTRGHEQYEAESGDPFAHMLRVQEGPASFMVNLEAYLDSGLFLDHRPLRRMIAERAAGKRVLNLFCYTASITVQAALGGAASSVSVDMSKTYIQWAKKNFQLNGLDLKKHLLVQEDCLAWLKSCRQGFDIIVLDPPSFSNSKRMEGVLDIQRDHVALIRRCMDLLDRNGCLYFSNNLRSFKLAEDELAQFTITDISTKTLDPDFKRNPKIHRCWEIRPRQES